MAKKILLIEDDLPTIDVYETVLKKAGFGIETIRWGEEALNKVRKIKEGKTERPDLVLLDLILPDINGIRVLEEIRNYEETKDIPVFVLTNYADERLEKMGYNLKAEKYLLKTEFNPRELVGIIKEQLGEDDPIR